MSNNYYAKYQKYKTKFLNLNLKIKNLYNQSGGMEEADKQQVKDMASTSPQSSEKCIQLLKYDGMIRYYMDKDKKTQQQSIDKIKRKWGQIYGNRFRLELFTNTETNMDTQYNTPYSAREIMKQVISDQLHAYKIETNTLTILDANSNIGMDALTFCEYFKHVICIEKDINFFCALQENMKLPKERKASIYNGSCLDFLKIGPSYDKSLSASSSQQSVDLLSSSSAASSQQSVDLTPFSSVAFSEPSVDQLSSSSAASSQSQTIANTIDVIYFDPPWASGGRNYRTFGMLNLDGIPMDQIVNSCFLNYNTLKAIYLKFPCHRLHGTPNNDKIISSLFNTVAKQLGLIFGTLEIRYLSDNHYYTFNLHYFLKINS